MLIRFAVENFLSFKGTVDFLMTASADEVCHQHHIVTKKDNKILKGSFLFGANASGKSNFIKAIDFAKDVVEEGLSRIDLDRKYFRIDPDYKKHPGVFQFDIFTEEEFYSYGFAISYIDSSIQEEWLYKMGPDGNDECIFLRRKENEKTTVKTDLKFDAEVSNKFKVYSDDITRMENVLFLSDVSIRASSEQGFKHFKAVRHWFNKLMVIFPDSKSLSLNMMVRRDSYRKRLESMLNFFDTGIVSISQIELAIDAVFNNTPSIVVERIKSDFIKELRQQDGYAILNDGESVIEINLKDNELYGKKIVSNHGNKSDFFEFIDESDGTKRLFDLIPLFFLVEDNSVIIIDEIDRSLHTKAVLEFINIFYNTARNNESQLIATTHDSNILNLENIRRDEIWFIERNKDQSSRLFSLSQFKARLGEDIEKDYILGRYGAIPIFNTILLERGDVNDDE